MLIYLNLSTATLQICLFDFYIYYSKKYIKYFIIKQKKNSPKHFLYRTGSPVSLISFISSPHSARFTRETHSEIFVCFIGLFNIKIPKKFQDSRNFRNRYSRYESPPRYRLREWRRLHREGNRNSCSITNFIRFSLCGILQSVWRQVPRVTVADFVSR